jgi:hypothetical protein
MAKWRLSQLLEELLIDLGEKDGDFIGMGSIYWYKIDILRVDSA